MVSTMNTLGNFVELDTTQEHLLVNFVSSELTIHDRWLNNHLLADFLSDYSETFILAHTYLTEHACRKFKDTIRYMTNELLDNAVKYNSGALEEAIMIGIWLSPERLRCYVTNRTDVQTAERFQQYVQRLLTEPPSDSYIRQVEANAREENSTVSRLGLLTIMYNHQAQLAWKFEIAAHNSDLIVVTTMAEIALV
jgi:hypothetical protein